jgi:hypothetical protein
MQEDTEIEMLFDFNKSNGNGRVYIASDGLNDKLQKLSNEGKLFAQLDHNGYPDIVLSTPNIMLTQITHMVKDAHMCDSKIYGNLVGLNVPSFKILKNLLDSGLVFTLVPIGFGRTNGDGVFVVEDINGFTHVPETSHELNIKEQGHDN